MEAQSVDIDKRLKSLLELLVLEYSRVTRESSTSSSTIRSASGSSAKSKTKSK